MTRNPIAVGKEVKKVSIDVIFNGGSGALPERLMEYLGTSRIRALRGGGIVDNDTGGKKEKYFSGDYTPESAALIKEWLRENGVVFRRKSSDR